MPKLSHQSSSSLSGSSLLHASTSSGGGGGVVVHSGGVDAGIAKSIDLLERLKGISEFSVGLLRVLYSSSELRCLVRESGCPTTASSCKEDNAAKVLHLLNTGRFAKIIATATRKGTEEAMDAPTGATDEWECVVIGEDDDDDLHEDDADEDEDADEDDATSEGNEEEEKRRGSVGSKNKKPPKSKGAHAHASDEIASRSRGGEQKILKKPSSSASQEKGEGGKSKTLPLAAVQVHDFESFVIEEGHYVSSDAVDVDFDLE